MKFLKRLFPFAIIAAAALVLLYLPDMGPERYTDLATYFRTELARQGFSGYAVAAVRDGAVLYVDAFGTDGAGKPLATDLPLPLGPLSEGFAGLVVRSLEAEGRLDLDRPIADYLPGFVPPAPPPLRDKAPPLGDPTVPGAALLLPASPPPGPEVPAVLGARALLAHRSGIDARGLPPPAGEEPSLIAGRLSLARAVAAPGEVYHRLPEGYRALALALERASGQPYAELLERRVLGPLGLASALVLDEAQRSSDIQGLPAGSASLFGAVLPRSARFLPGALASEQLCLSPADMAVWLAWNAAPEKSRRRLLPARALPALRQPLYEGGNYGYGWRFRGEGEELELYQGGSLSGWQAAAALWPAKRAAVAVLAPQSGLVSSGFALPALLEGARRVMLEGGSEPGFPFGRLWLLLAVSAVVSVLALALQTGGALRWARDKRNRAEASGGRSGLRFTVARTWVGILVRLGLAWALPALLAFLLDRPMPWSEAFALEPGLAGWIAALIGFGLLRNLTRLAWLR